MPPSLLQCTNKGNNHLCPAAPLPSAGTGVSVGLSVFICLSESQGTGGHRQALLPRFTYLTHLIMFVLGAGYVCHRAYVPTYRGSLQSEIETEQNTNKTSLHYVAISWELAFLLPCGYRAGVWGGGVVESGCQTWHQVPLPAQPCHRPGTVLTVGYT